MAENQIEVPGYWPPAGGAANLFQIGMTQTTVSADQESPRMLFEHNHALQLTDVLEPGFEAQLMRFCAEATFLQEKPRIPEVEYPQRVGRILDVAIGRSKLFRWLEDVTDCEPLVAFRGRLTQTRANTGDRRGWHDDLDESAKRRLALVINLSPEPFEGGTFQIRRKTGERVLQHRYQRFGEAILFRVDPAMEHQVNPVLAGGPRRVYAGWFLSA